jgi:hypothetical protein
VCREGILAVDLGRTRVGVLEGIGISLIGDRGIGVPGDRRFAYKEIAIRDSPIQLGPSIL